ncbi:PTS sugar transporter subunit IIC, partial [Clostridium perfringens]|nr:PTS sugar transporter subunit IIC [Clostridium perfringens]
MEVSIFQAILIGILAYAGSLSGALFLGTLGGWYVLSRPLVSGLLIGLILG